MLTDHTMLKIQCLIDHTMLKIQFRSSFNGTKKLKSLSMAIENITKNETIGK